MTLDGGKTVGELAAFDGNSQARKIIQREIAGWCFREVDDEVRLEVETVEATDVDVVVSVFGMVGVGVGGGPDWKEKEGIHGMGGSRVVAHVAWISMLDGGKASAVRLGGSARIAADRSGWPHARRLSAMMERQIATQP